VSGGYSDTSETDVVYYFGMVDPGTGLESAMLSFDFTTGTLTHHKLEAVVSSTGWLHDVAIHSRLLGSLVPFQGLYSGAALEF